MPSAVQGPSSMPCIWSAVHHQPTPARAKSTATSPSRARAAAKRGGKACAARRRSSPGDHRLRRPRRSRPREPGLALVLDAERVDLRALRLRHREIGARRVEHAGEADRLARLDAEGHDVLDLEVDRVPDRGRCGAARRGRTSIGTRSTPSTSPTSGASPAIGPPSWPPKTWTSLSACSSLARSSTNIPSRQFPSVMTLGVSMIATTLRPPTSVPSISPSRMSKASVARQKS